MDGAVAAERGEAGAAASDGRRCAVRCLVQLRSVLRYCLVGRYSVFFVLRRGGGGVTAFRLIYVVRIHAM